MKVTKKNNIDRRSRLGKIVQDLMHPEESKVQANGRPESSVRIKDIPEKIPEEALTLDLGVFLTTELKTKMKELYAHYHLVQKKKRWTHVMKKGSVETGIQVK